MARYRPAGAYLLDEDGVGLAQGIEALLGHFADTAHAESRPGEGVPHHEFIGQAQLGAERCAPRL